MVRPSRGACRPLLPVLRRLRLPAEGSSGARPGPRRRPDSRHPSLAHRSWFPRSFHRPEATRALPYKGEIIRLPQLACGLAEIVCFVQRSHHQLRLAQCPADAALLLLVLALGRASVVSCECCADPAPPTERAFVAWSGPASKRVDVPSEPLNRGVPGSSRAPMDCLRGRVRLLLSAKGRSSRLSPARLRDPDA